MTQEFSQLIELMMGSAGSAAYSLLVLMMTGLAFLLSLIILFAIIVCVIPSPEPHRRLNKLLGSTILVRLGKVVEFRREQADKDGDEDHSIPRPKPIPNGDGDHDAQQSCEE